MGRKSVEWEKWQRIMRMNGAGRDEQSTIKKEEVDGTRGKERWRPRCVGMVSRLCVGRVAHDVDELFPTVRKYIRKEGCKSKRTNERTNKPAKLSPASSSSSRKSNNNSISSSTLWQVASWQGKRHESGTTQWRKGEGRIKCERVYCRQLNC